MVFSNFSLNIVLRVIVICVLAILLGIVLSTKNWFFTPLVISISIVLITINLIFYLQKTNNDLANFLLAIKQGGFTSQFSHGKRGGAYNKLSEAFNQVISEFQKVSLEKESHYQYLQTINENIGVALISFTEDGKIEMVNKAARALLNKPLMNRIDELGKIDSKLYEVVMRLESGENEMVKVVFGGEVIHLAVQAKVFILKEKTFKLILMQNINSELEEKEVEAWQKLISVLTHEIMNSVTPIVSLASAMNTMLSNTDGAKRDLNSLQHEEIEDVYGSIDTIESRGKGLLKFVNAYKDYSKSPELNYSDFDLVAMIDRIRSLLKPNLEKNGIELKFVSALKSHKVHADSELMEQVIINIIKNAMEALENTNNGVIKIFIKKLETGRTHISISDNGPGIDGDTIDKIFVPFYTTKQKGTGVGLSLSRQILRLHNGNLGVQSKVGEGTAFSLQF